MWFESEFRGVRVMHSYSFTEARVSIRVKFRARVRRLGFGTGWPIT